VGCGVSNLNPLLVAFAISSFFKHSSFGFVTRCVFGEILLGHPVLPGNTDLDQLNHIFKLVGTPNEESWPNWTSLPGMDGVEGFKQYSPTLKERFSE
jgi:hypothetical protein